MEPLLFDLNGAQNQSNPIQAPSNCPSTEHLCTKRRLEAHHDAMSPSPRKKRKCNTAPPRNTRLEAQFIKEREYHNLSLTQSASPHHQSQSLMIHPTVTILSSYDDSNINDGHHSNVAISRKTKTQLAQSNNININTVKVENDGQQPQKKPIFSMTIQKKTNNIAPKNNTVSVFNMDVDQTSLPALDKAADINTVSNQNNAENHNPNNPQTLPITSDFVKEQDVDKESHLERIPKQNGEAPPKKEEATQNGEIAMKLHTKQTRLMRLLLDAKRVGGLIGKGGSAITKIRQKSRAKILIAKPIPHSLFRICSIEGEYEQIVCGINLVIDKMAEESTRLPPFQITVLVEEKNIGCLIGKKGNAITEIRNSTNANIYISSHLLRNSSEKTVDICGERDAVHCAIEMVIKRLCNNPSYVSTRMPYDPSMDFIQAPMKSVCEHPLNASTYPYPYHFAPNMANSPRLLNYALSNRFGAIPSVQPQIISTTPTALLTPLLSNTFSYRTAAAAGASFNIPQTSNHNPNLSKQTPSNSMTSHVSNLQNMQSLPMHHSNAKSNNININNNSRNINNNHNNNNNNVVAVAHNNNNSNNNANNYIRSALLSHSNNNTHTQNNGAPAPHVSNRYPPHFQRLSPYSYSPRIIPPTPPPHAATAAAAASAAHTSVVLPVASHLIGGVIGRGGRNIQEIRRQTNAEIKIDNERQNKSKERYITINGTPQQISTAVYMIQNSLATHT